MQLIAKTSFAGAFLLAAGVALLGSVCGAHQGIDNDPRFGDTTYRLTNSVQSNQALTLFEVPSDFEIIEGPGAVYRELRMQ